MKLTKNSKYLMLFFNQNDYIINHSLDDQSKKILKEIYNKIFESYYYQNKHPINYTVKINKIKTITPSSNFDSSFFPKKIRDHIFETSSFEIIYEFSVFDREIKVIFIIDDKSYPKLDKYNNHIKKIFMWLYILKSESSNKCSKTLKIYFYFTDFEKHLPTDKSEILGPYHVNTAFTTSCSEDAEIILYRKEEWFKVFIHESFHSFGLDFSIMDNSRVSEYIRNIFKVKSKVNLYESYTECWAEIINLSFCSFYDLEIKDDSETFISNFETLIDYEISYSLFQMVKILNYQNFKYNDLLLSQPSYRENSNILAYYIIKTILIVNYQQFLLWCNENNKKLFQFKKTTECLDKFCEFIKTIHKIDKLNHYIKKIETLYDHITFDHKHNYLLTNMRMSICEML